MLKDTGVWDPGLRTSRPSLLLERHPQSGAARRLAKNATSSSRRYFVTAAWATCERSRLTTQSILFAVGEFQDTFESQLNLPLGLCGKIDGRSPRRTTVASVFCFGSGNLSIGPPRHRRRWISGIPTIPSSSSLKLVFDSIARIVIILRDKTRHHTRQQAYDVFN